MRIVLDTTVLVSAFFRPAGSPGRVLDLVILGELNIVYDDRIFLEYQDVLHRPRFGFLPEDIAAILDHFRFTGLHINATLLQVNLPDPDDQPFLEVAFAARVPLIPGNQKHFPPEIIDPLKIRVLAPTQFLNSRGWK